MDLGFDVVAFEPTDHVAEGDVAPEFERPLVTHEEWADATLGEVCADDGAVVLFHPMDGDFPATYIWQSVRDRGWVDDLDARVVGLSISTPYEHKAFLREWRDFEQFELFSDPANGVAEAFDIVHDLDGMAGIAEPRPAAYVLEPDRTVAYAWVAETWPEFPPYDEVEAAAAGL